MSWYIFYMTIYGYLLCYIKCIAAKSNQELLNDVANSMIACVAEMPENFDLNNCQEMLVNNTNHDDAKYAECKCLGFCTAKKIKVMNQDGTGNTENLKAFVDGLENAEWKKEGMSIVDKCGKNLAGKGCELAYNFLKCSMETSSVMKEFMRLVMGSAKE